MRSHNFPKNYDWEVLQGLPGTGKIYQFPIHRRRDFESVYVVKVFLSSENYWIADFQGIKNHEGFSGVFSTPNPDIICIVVGMEGYLVNVKQPSDYQDVDAFAITDVVSMLEFNTIIFVGMANLVCYGSEGKIWETERFGNGEIIVSKADKDGIIGTYWKPEVGGYPKFHVNPRTGEVDFPDS